MTKPKVLVIVGPTASGKSDLAVWLAKKYNGEVVSADSRQVYKGFDIGSGKINKSEMQGIKHYMLDVASPRIMYDVTRYKRDATSAINTIIKKNKFPIIAGGTGFYIDALIYDQNFPEVKPNNKLRRRLENKSVDELLIHLKKLDPKRASSIQKNKRRIIRSIEIAEHLGRVPKVDKDLKYDVLKIGITLPKETLKDKISKRLISRINEGIINEVKKLRKTLSWKKLESFGLEYKYIAQFLQSKLSKEEMISKLNSEIWRYAKRQMTWFKRDKDIHWIKSKKDAEKLVKEFLRAH